MMTSASLQLKNFSLKRYFQVFRNIAVPITRKDSTVSEMIGECSVVRIRKMIHVKATLFKLRNFYGADLPFDVIIGSVGYLERCIFISVSYRRAYIFAVNAFKFLKCEYIRFKMRK